MIALFNRYVVHNFGLKLISLVLASGLWLMISRDEEPAEVAVRAPIVFQNVPAHLEISTENISEAQIRVRGPERLVRQIQARDVHAEIDLVGVKPGERTFDLSAQQVRHPRELTVVQVVPSQLHLSFDTSVSREVEIHPHVTGNFPAGEQIVKIEADPPRIVISGPRQHIERIESATTDPIDATGTTSTGVFTTNVFVPDPLVQVTQATPVRVTVTVQKVGSATTH